MIRCVLAAAALLSALTHAALAPDARRQATTRAEHDAMHGAFHGAVADFPFGTYGFSISDQDPAANPDLVGSWQITFSPDLRFVASKDGEQVADGGFELSCDELVWHNDPNGPCPEVGRYRWTVTAGGDTLRLAPIADPCDARVAVLGGRALVKR